MYAPCPVRGTVRGGEGREGGGMEEEKVVRGCVEEEKVVRGVWRRRRL